MRGWALTGAVALVAFGVLGVLAIGPKQERLTVVQKLRDFPSQPLVHRGAAVPLPHSGSPPELSRSGWPSANHDYANTRATTDSTITSKTVGRLRPSWALHLSAGSKWGSAATAPLIVGDTVYFQDLLSNVYALDLKTGAARWVQRIDEKAFGPNGPAVGWGRVYVQDGRRSVLALDAGTGRALWTTPLAGPTGQEQPVVWSGSVFTGIAAGRMEQGPGPQVLGTGLLRPGSSGFAYGIRASDGAVAWQLQTVAAGFWGKPAVNGGGGIWFSPAIDPGTGLTFWGTGNPGPAPGTSSYPNASSRPGPNLYTNSVLAIDARTGKLRWYRQLLPHDIFHHDLQNAPILVSAGGRPLVIASGKMGIVYALDRRTGKLVWKRPVGRHQNDGLRRLPPGKAVQVYPGFWGGVETPGAYAGGTLYFEVDNLPTPYTATAWNAENGEDSVNNLEGRTSYANGTSELVALSAATGRVEWVRRFPTVGFGAATVVNDLVFTTTYDGVVYALRRSDGRVVWRWHAPGGINGWPAVVGGTLVLPVGLGPQPQLMALSLTRGDHP